MSENNMISVEAAAAKVLGYIRTCEISTTEIIVIQVHGATMHG
jgi:hypothetical protein